MAPQIRRSGPRPRGGPSNVARARERMEREKAEALAKKEAVEKEAAAAADASRMRSTTAVKGPQCANKNCTNSKIVDGTCTNCGRVIDDSNIVAEVQFGESSSGAAMVHGSYVGADQGGARSLGPGFRRGGGSDQREKSVAEARSSIQGIAAQLSLSRYAGANQDIVDIALRTYKLAAQHGFTQGRPIQLVCAVCIYLAFRKQTEDPNEKPKIMLLDLADLVKINVFKLGRTFKALCEKISADVSTIFPEDIIFRFACKLEFGNQTAKVAEDAVRLIKSMRRDWIIIGRRPSGICGACLLMAARMNNFRRTVREVVYVVKVTSHTIQERMKEFNETAASKMTVDDFLSPDFLESNVSHDPPSFYRNNEEYKQKLQETRRKRKRSKDDDGSQERGDSQTPNPGAQGEASLSSSIAVAVGPTGPDLSTVPSLSDLYRRDADGYLIPPLPPKDGKDDPTPKETDSADYDALVKEFGDEDQTKKTTKPRGRPAKNPGPQLPVNEEWEGDEEEIEEQISEIMNDPETLEHANAYGNAEQRARIHAMWALQKEPSKEVSMDPLVGEDEFADDPEVANAVLTPEEAKLKELLWVNENKEWLRQNQERIWQRKLAGDKPKRPRKARKPRLGEGQTTPASTPIEAAQNVMKHHGMSKRINYDAIQNLLNPDGSASDTASGQTSKANSVFGDAFRDRGEDEVEEDEGEEEDDEGDGQGDGDGGEDDEQGYLDEYDEFGIDEMGDEVYDHGYDDD